MTPSPRSSGVGKRSISKTTLSSGLRSLRSGIADVDAVAENSAIDAHQSLAVALEIGADELPRRSFENANNLAGGEQSGRLGLRVRAHEHGVAGGGVEGMRPP